MNSLSLRAKVYSFLSEAFKQPTPEFIAGQKDIVAFLEEAFASLAYSISPADYRDWPALASDITALMDAYYESFVFPPATRVLPVESVHRRRMENPGAEICIRETDALMSDYALHMNTLYNAFGIIIPHEYQATPDHLSLQLSLAAFLLTNEPPDRLQDFLNEHLNWVDYLLADACEKSIPLYYRQIIKVTAAFLREEAKRSKA